MEILSSLTQPSFELESAGESFSRHPIESNPDAHPGIVVEELELPAALEASQTEKVVSPAQAWKVFCTTFVTIFLAELGDKTQISTLLMSAKFHAPWVVFTGAAIALILTSLLGVLVGRWLSTRLSPKVLDKAAGVTLALISVWLVWDVFQG